MKSHSSLWILLLFGLSILVRIPTLNRPLSKHHEFTTAFVVRIMQIWREDGLLKHYGAPIMNYPGAANKFINNETLGYFDTKGDDYYQSYPPFAYMLPYLVFRALNIYPNALALECFNLFLHLIEAFILYHVAVLLFKWKDKHQLFIPGIVAVTLYLFNPCALWFHSNVYQADMPGVTWWLLATFLFLKMEEKEKLTSPLWLLMIFTVNFFLNYTEYMGVMFSAVVGLYCLYRFIKNRKYFLPAIVIGLSCLSALGLTTWQYAHINGFAAFRHIAKYRYAIRGGYKSHGGFQKLSILASSWLMVFKNYIISYLPLLLLLLILLILVLRKKDIRENLFASPFKQIMLFFFLPVLLHHFIFLNASMNDFLLLKSGAFIVLIIAWLLYLLMKKDEISQFALSLSTGLTVVICLVMFYFINRPGQLSLKGDHYNKFKTDGEFIARQSQPDEVIFIRNILDEPQLILYAHRNMCTIAKDDDAYNFLRTYGRHKGIIFAADSVKTVHFIKHIEL